MVSSCPAPLSAFLLFLKTVAFQPTLAKHPDTAILQTQLILLKEGNFIAVLSGSQRTKDRQIPLLKQPPKLSEHKPLPPLPPSQG